MSRYAMLLADRKTEGFPGPKSKARETILQNINYAQAWRPVYFDAAGSSSAFR